MPIEITYQRPWLYPLQERAIFDDAARIAIIEASVKSGKTAGCLAWLAEQAFVHGKVGRNYWWIAPVYGQSKIAFRRMKESIPRRVYRSNESEMRITLINGAAIEFRSAEKPDGLFGEDVYAAVLDEASRMREESWHAVRSTLTATRGPVRMIGNVHGRKNWFYRLARIAEAGDTDMAYHRIDAFDAIAGGVITAEEVEAAQRDFARLGKEGIFRQLYMAEAADDGENPFGLDAIRACCEGIEGFSTEYPAAAGVDLAGRGAQNIAPRSTSPADRDYTAITVLDRTGHAVRIERFRKPHTETSERIVQVVGHVPVLLDSTGAGDAIVETLQRRGDMQALGYTYTERSRQELLEHLALYIGEGDVHWPDEDDGAKLRLELEAFEYVYTRRGVSWRVPDGIHDDCLKPGTLVKTEDGYQPIESIGVGDFVLTHAGRYRPVEACLAKPFEGDFYKLRFRNQLPLSLSYNHPVQVAARDFRGYRDGPFDRRLWELPGNWKPSHRGITLIDPLVDQEIDGIGGSDLYIPTGNEKLNHVEFDDDFAAFLGRFLADGWAAKTWVKPTPYMMALCFSNKEADSAERFEEWLSLLGIRHHRTPGKGSFTLAFSSRLLWTLMGFAYAPSGEKILPSFAAGFGRQRLSLVLDEWLAGDGWHHTKAPYVIGCTTSRQLALSMRDIAHGINRYAAISERTGLMRLGRPCKDQFWVTVYDNPGSWPTTGGTRRISEHEACSPLVSEQREFYRGPVFNLRVEEDESFIAEGVVVHNCAMSLGLAVRRMPWRRKRALMPVGIESPGGSRWTGVGGDDAWSRYQQSLKPTTVGPHDDEDTVPLPVNVGGGPGKWR